MPDATWQTVEDYGAGIFYVGDDDAGAVVFAWDRPLVCFDCSSLDCEHVKAVEDYCQRLPRGLRDA